jgi:hypothetical protein
MTNRIVAAAILADGVIYSLPPPARHGTVMYHYDIGLVENSIQGFIDTNGVFLSREDALVVANAANQIIEKTGYSDLALSQLFSEDVW